MTAREDEASRARRERMLRILGASGVSGAEGVLPGGTTAVGVDRAFARPESEDDDGYDPYSDRPAPRESLFEANPWD